MKRQRTEPNSASKGNAATPDTAWARLPTPLLEETTATLSGILQTHTLEKMQATLSTMQTEVTTIKDTQLHLSNQALNLQKRNKEFYTQLRDLPLEVIVQIFAWIPVQTVFRYRRLSRTINQCLLTTQFAMLNLVVPPPYQTVVARAMAPHATTIGVFDYNPSHYKKVAKSLPNSISCLTAVEEIRLEANTLIGEIPDVFGALKNLTHLCLPSNSLTGALPSSLNLLSELFFLDLSHNELTGEFPPLPNLNSLQILVIGRNHFTGTVPTVFGKHRILAFLHADHNRFSVIPASISQLTRLYHLYISGNPFSCEIPSELWNLTDLTDLRMSGCNMFGSLAGVGNLHNLQILDVSNNQFSGEFPSREILNLPDMNELHMAGNQFTGGEIMDLSQRDIKMTMCVDRDL
ncbi:hypothetical protein HDU77_011041 [Chytriomyces hyalinus]|nr:hypothetical protein HDU77_011041 [Chytriomyces hyalinus]